MQTLREWFGSLQPRERLVVAAGAVIVVVVALYMLLVPFYSAVDAQARRVAQKEGDLAWMRSVVGEIQALSANAPQAGPSNESLVVLIDRTARECGLGSALTGQTPSGANGIRVRLESAEFDKLVVCLANLSQSHGITIDSAAIDRTSQPGLVNASIILMRPGG
ncbi:MAG TPA: type II secretion system protein GspM [Steroidobacter sp.]